MLVLTRIPGEGITLFLKDGREISIKLLNIKNKGYADEAAIGITADQDITILRNELVTRENCTFEIHFEQSEIIT